MIINVYDLDGLLIKTIPMNINSSLRVEFSHTDSNGDKWMLFCDSHEITLPNIRILKKDASDAIRSLLECFSNNEKSYDIIIG